MANLQAAIMCNHKRTIPKTFEMALEKKRETLKNLRKTVPKTDKQKIKLKEREEKLKLAIDLQEKTRDYNLGTSLRNYIDPRVFKAWTDEVKADWEKLYTSSLQRKFLWVKNVNDKWQDIVAQ
jgi:DNA topoisomerase-1